MTGDRNGGDIDVPEDEQAAQAASARQYDWRPRPDPTLLTTQQLRETEAALNRTIAERVNGLRELLEQRLDGMDKATELVADRLDKFSPSLEAGRQQLRAEREDAVTHLRELLESRIDGMDKAIELLASSVDKSPTDIEKAVAQLRDLLGARIDGMDKASDLLAENVRQFPSDLDKATKALREVLEGQIRSVQDVALEKFAAIDGTFASNALALTAALAAQKEAAAEQNKSNTLAITKSEQATKETIVSNASTTQASVASLVATISDLKDRLVRMEAGGVAVGTERSERRLDYGQVISVVAVIISIAAVLILAFRK